MSKPTDPWLSPLLWRSGLRHLRRHPWLMILSVLGVALGVAVVVAIDLANGSAQRAFELSNEQISGRTTHQIEAGPAGLSEQLYVKLRVEHGFRNAAPIVDGYVSAAHFPARTFQLLGVDSLAEPPFRNYSTDLDGQDFLSQLLTVPGAVMMTESSAKELGLAIGQDLRVRIQGEIRHLRIVEFMRPANAASAQALADVLVTDIATAQEMLHRVGRLSRIDLVLSHEDLQRLPNLLPPEAQLIATKSANDVQAQMTRAFRTNLTAMSLLALLVGGFIIFNTMSFSVLQRRRLFGLQRALGVSARQIWTMVMSEALLIGCLGAVIGIALGIALGDALLGLVTRTINDLYFSLTVRELHLSVFSIIKGLILGLGVTLLACAPPTWEATRTPARATLSRSFVEEKMRRLVKRLAMTGSLTMIAGGGVLLYPGSSLFFGFLGLFLLVIGYAMLSPRLVMLLIAFISRMWPSGQALLTRMAVVGVVKSLSRTGVAIAALMVAIATTLGVSTMVDSFRNSVVNWIEHTLRADIYISPAEHLAAQQSGLPRSLVANLRSIPEVKSVSLGRRVDVPVGARRLQLVALELPPEGFAGFQLLQSINNPQRAFQNDQAILVSEPYAYRFSIRPGDVMTLPTAEGEQAFHVAGIYRDYGSEHGRIVMRQDLYESLWHDPVISNMGLYLHEGARPADVLRKVRASLPAEPALRLRSNADIRAATIEVFDRTFVITDVLRLLTLLVAFVGILTALMALQLERAREFAVLRATGLTPRQLRTLVTTETGTMGLVAGLLALPLGVLLAAVLILVINRRAFGWSMSMTFEAGQLTSALLLALLAAVLAGVYPAYRMARVRPGLALREE